jgi:cytoskeletal protein RodZ
MPLIFEDLDSIAISEVGSELAAARNLLNKTSSDFILDLRTTRHHVNAIEAGDLRIFYGAPFYIDLLKRYAKSLNFSDNKILLFEKRVLGFGEEKPESLSGKFDKEGLNISSDLGQNSLSKSNRKIFSNVKIKRKKISIDPAESKILKEKNDRLLLLLVVITIIIAGLVFILPNNQIKDSDASSFAGQIKTEKNNTKTKLPVTNITNKEESEQNLLIVGKSSIKSEFKGVNTINYDQISNLKTSESEASVIGAEVISNNPELTVSLIENVETIEQGSEMKRPNVSLFASEKTWFWIRYADDSIKEFMVDANTKTDVLKYPIYLVIGKPETVEMSINGSIVSIERNDPDRNLARFTRTELRAMEK